MHENNHNLIVICDVRSYVTVRTYRQRIVVARLLGLFPWRCLRDRGKGELPRRVQIPWGIEKREKGEIVKWMNSVRGVRGIRGERGAGETV